MEELNKLEKLEVEDIVDQRKADYCKIHCAEFFVSNKRLNSVLYIIGTVILLISGGAISYAIPQAATVAAYITKTDQNTKDIESLQNINKTMDSVYATVKFIKNMRVLYGK